MFPWSAHTFKPHKKAPDGSKQSELSNYVATTLGSGNLRLAVKLPEGEDLNEWLAANTVDFFNQINLLYGTLTEFCTSTSCPIMSAGAKYEYLWKDETMKKPEPKSAPVYIDLLMTWVQRLIDDETVFPQKVGVPFPSTFLKTVKSIYRRLFRVFGHIYYSHMAQVEQLGLEAHLNTSLKHFVFFVREFNLIPSSELAPLSGFIDKLCGPEK